MAFIVVTRARDQRDVFESAVAVVVKKHLAYGVVGHKNIHKAVAIKVSERQTETFPRSVRDLRTTADILKRAVRFLVKKKISRGLEIVGMTKRAVVAARAEKLTQVSGLAAEKTASLEVPIHVTKDEEVEPSIAIVVEPTGAGGPSRSVEPQLTGYIRKGAVTLIAVHNIAAISRNVEIDESVVIVIAGGHTEAVAVAFDA